MKFIQCLTGMVLVLFLGACQNGVAPSPISSVFVEQGIAESREGFPTVFLYSGSDELNTYRSLRSYRRSDGSLQLELGGWGITEMGIMLWRERDGNTLRLRLMHDCGTVSSITHEKVKFDHQVTPVVEDSLSRIVYIASQDSLVLEKSLAGGL